MSIRRQYSLPNCTLVLEGYPDTTPHIVDSRPVMSLLVNVECSFGPSIPPLSGGREFFESLVMSVSSYSQEFLSGIPHTPNTQPSLVTIEPINNYLHRLSVQTETEIIPNPKNRIQSKPRQETISIDLTTVQLFDLVEAIDQFLADSSTLPELVQYVSPISRKDILDNEPILKRSAPIALGVTTLAVTSLTMLLLPVPKIKPPTEIASPTPTETPTASPTPTGTPNLKDLQELLNSNQKITDPTAIRFLQRTLYNNIYKSWEPKVLSDKLEYRVAVGKDGAIIAYKAITDNSSSLVNQTPLPGLLYVPIPGSDPNQELIGDFKVVFTKGGVIQISPWEGYKGNPGLGPLINDSQQITQLNQKLQTSLSENYQKSNQVKSDLIYRVGVTKEGIIADYEPDNQEAFDYLKETPLPKLKQDLPLTGGVPTEPLAQFQVIFKPNGKVEIKKWPDIKSKKIKNASSISSTTNPR